MAGALQLDDAKRVLKQYYAGAQMDSPNGGFLMLLGIRAGEGGASVGLLECSVSSLRFPSTSTHRASLHRPEGRAPTP